MKTMNPMGVIFDLEMTDFDFGGDRYLRTGEVLPETAADELRRFDAIYLGAIGHPDVKPGILEKGILLRLRFELDQFINLRSVLLYPGKRGSSFLTNLFAFLIQQSFFSASDSSFPHLLQMA